MSCLGIVGEHLTKNLRMALLDKLLHLEVGYFDHEENSMGALTEFLASKVTLVQTLVGEKAQVLVRIVMLLTVSISLMVAFGAPAMIGVCVGSFPVLATFMGILVSIELPKPEKPPDDDEVAAENENKAAKASFSGAPFRQMPLRNNVVGVSTSSPSSPGSLRIV